MANDSHINNFTAYDIEKYHKGLLSSKERHDLEKAALDDPFLADALEGYATTGINVAGDIHQLKQRLGDKVGSANVIKMASPQKSIPWLRVAAVIVIVAGASLLIYRFAATNNNKKNEPIANVGTADKKATEEVKPVDTNRAITPGTFAWSDSNKTGATTETALYKNNNVSANLTITAPDSISSSITSSEYNYNVLHPADSVRIAPSYFSSTVSAPSATITTKAPEKNTNKKGSGEFPAVPKKYESDNVKDDKFASNSRRESKNDSEKVVSSGLFANDELYRAKDQSKRKMAEVSIPTNVFRGRITDADNNGLPFANVTNTNDNVGTYSDAKGNFVLISPDTVLNVQVRSIGFNSNNTQLRNGLTATQVVMQEDKTLNEVVISNKKPNAEARSRNGNVKIEEPVPVDGWDKYDAYLANNLNIPEEVKTKQVFEGQVEVSFEVDKNGEPINIKIEKSLCAKCDQEAIRLIKEGPKWKRKAKKGRTTVTIPFN